jgi:flagellar basal body-associated protein FliL
MMGMPKNDNGKENSGGGVNWTIVLTVTLSVLIVSLVGPVVWRATAAVSAQEAKWAGAWMLIILTLVVLFGGLVLVMRAFAQMQLRAVEQDDADELRKSQQQAAQFAKLLQQVIGQQGSGVDVEGLARIVSAGSNGSGPVMTPYRDLSRDVSME